MPINLSMIIQAGLPTVTFSSMQQLLDEIQFEETIGNSLVIKERFATFSPSPAAEPLRRAGVVADRVEDHAHLAASGAERFSVSRRRTFAPDWERSGIWDASRAIGLEGAGPDRGAGAGSTSLDPSNAR